MRRFDVSRELGRNRASSWTELERRLLLTVDVEPNDTLVQATGFLSPSDVLTGAFSNPADVDVFRTFLAQGETLEIVPGTYFDEAFFAPAVDILDAAGVVKSAAIDGSGIDFTAPSAAQYYVRLKAQTTVGTFQGTYSVTTFVSPYSGATEAEPNDSLVSATALSGASTFRGTLASPSDVDNFSFPGVAGAVVSVKFTDQPSNNPSVRLFDPSGNPVATNLTGFGFQATLNSFGAYTLSLRSDNSSGTVTGGYAGSYVLSGSPTLEAEPDDSFSGAIPWSASGGSHALGLLSTVSDVDTFALDLSATNLYEFDIDDTPGSISTQNRVMTLYNEFGQFLQSSKTGQLRSDGITYRPEKNARYYLTIQATTATGEGFYSIASQGAIPFPTQRDVPLFYHDYTQMSRPDIIPELIGFFESRYDPYVVDVTTTNPGNNVEAARWKLTTNVGGGSGGSAGGYYGVRRPTGSGSGNLEPNIQQLADIWFGLEYHENGHIVGLFHNRQPISVMSAGAYAGQGDIFPAGSFFIMNNTGGTSDPNVSAPKVVNERDYLDWVLTPGRIAPELEPNDANAQAQNLDPFLAEMSGDADPRNDQVTIAGRITGPSDVDSYRFNASAGQTFALDVDSAEFQNPLDSVLSLYDAAGNLLATSDDAMDRNTGITSVDPYLMFTFAVAGTYTVKVASKSGTFGDYRFRFTPDRAFDRTGPRVLASWPNGGASVNSTRQLTFWFNDEIDPATLTAANLIVTGATTGVRAGVATFDPQDSTLIWTADSPLPADTYTIRFRGGAGGVADLRGNLLDGETDGTLNWPEVSGNGVAGGDFVTTLRITGPDTTPASVLAVAYTRHPQGRGFFQLAMTDNLDIVDLYTRGLKLRGAGPDGLLDTADDQFLANDIYYDKIGDTVFPVIDLYSRGIPDAGTYRVEGTVLDAAGNNVVISRTFDVPGPPDPGGYVHGLSVASLSPMPGSVSTAIPSAVDITFSGMPDQSTLTTANVTLRRSPDPKFFDGNDSMVPGTIVWDATRLKASFQPSAPLGNGYFLLELNGDPGGITAATGELLDGEYVDTFIAGNTSPFFWREAPSGDGRPGGDYRAFFSINVPVGAAALGVFSSLAAPTYGQSLTFTAIVAPGPGGGPTPTGTVQFQADGVNFGPLITLVNGFAISPSIATLAAGSRTITVVYSGDGNYAANSASLILSVAKARLDVTVDPKSRLYGQANPALTASITGFVNGDTVAVITGTPMLGTTAIASSPVGSYPIAVGVGAMSAANYDFNIPVSGSLIVNPAHLTVVANDQLKRYDGNPFVGFSYHFAGFANGESSTVVTGAASLSGPAMTATNAGSYTIAPGIGTLTATNYDFTTFVNGTLTIAKAFLTVTADPKMKVYGQPKPALTATITGFVNGDTAAVVSGSPALTTLANTTSPVAAYAITVGIGTLTAANYDFPFANLVNGTLTVTKAHLTVAADPKSRLYGQPNPTLSAAISGFVNGDTIAVVSGSAALATSATLASPVGSYAISTGAGTLSATNYDFPNLVDSTLTINKAHLTVTADDQAKTYDGAPFNSFTARLTGFVNGETSSVVSGAADFSGAATTATNAGVSTITPGNGSLTATNYDFTSFVNGTLTIAKVHLTVAADPRSKLYGDPNPALTTVISGFVNGETAAVLSGAPALSTPATSASPVGMYAITVGAGTLAAVNYDFTNLAGSTLTITKAHLTVTADPKSKLYGQANPALTATFTGFVNGETTSAISGAAALATSATASSPIGSYAISVSVGTLSATNYDFSSLIDSTLTIDKAHLMVVADDQAKTYDGNTFSGFTTHLAGFVNGETSAVVSGAASVGGAAATATNAGVYSITPGIGTLSAANYDFATLVNGRLTIDKAQLNVAADPKAKFYSEPKPALSATITGFVNGDTAAVVNGGPALFTSANATSPAGLYAITVGIGTLSAVNYDFTSFVNSTLTVDKVHLTVKADPRSRLYGQANPAFTATITGFVNGETAAVVSGTPGLSTAATPASPVGDYAILVSPGTLSANNYDFANLVDGTLTVTRAHLTVVADDQARTYDGSTPSGFTTHFTGLVNGDSSAVVSGAASFGGSATTARNVGAYVIAPGAGDLTAANYDFTSFANGTLTINKAPLTVTADSKAKLYGDPNPALTATITGFASGENASLISGAANLSAPTSSASPVGSYTITVNAGTLSAANYTFTDLVNGTLSVNKAHLTVTADDQARTYDGKPFSGFTTHLAGFVNGESSAVVSGAASFSGAATTATNAGAYAIAPGAGSLAAANYDFASFVEGTLTINKAHLTVAADPKARFYGEPNPTLTATLIGFVNGDTAAVVSGSPILSTAATPASPAGTSTIFAVGTGTLAAVNYDFVSLVNSTLTINKAHLIVKAADATKLFGQPNPGFTGTYAGFVNGDSPASLTSPVSLRTAASTSSSPGAYPISVSGGSSSNYELAYQAGTLTIKAAPFVVVKKISVTQKRGAIVAVVVQFSGALDRAHAVSLGAYLLASGTTRKNVTVYHTPVALKSAAYDAARHRVTLTLKKPVPAATKLQLTIRAGKLTDTAKRAIDGDRNGKLGGSFVKAFGSKGISIASAQRATARPISARVVDAVLANGFRVGP